MFVIRRIKFETMVILDSIEQGHNLVHIVKKYYRLILALAVHLYGENQIKMVTQINTSSRFVSMMSVSKCAI